MRKYFIGLSVFLLIGCGGGSGSGSAPVETLPPGTEAMVTGELYEVTKGDMIVKVSEAAEVRITHKVGEINSTVELVQGKANIVRAQ